MSSSRRGREFISRRGIMSTPKARKFAPKEKVDYLNRVINRANKSAGYGSAKKESLWYFKFLVDGMLTSWAVEAHTKSEARAEAKKILGISRNSRLPSSVKVEKIND